MSGIAQAAFVKANRAIDRSEPFDFMSAHDRGRITPQLVKRPEPIFTLIDTEASTLLWPWVLRVDGFLADALDRYYLWYSTNHDPDDGGVYLATAPALEGPWTDRGLVFVDTVEGGQTETPSVLWNEATGTLHMYYHQNGLGNTQSTALATSPDGVTWTRVGKVIDVPDAVTFPGDGHTGYARPFRVGGLWCCYHVMGGGNYFHMGLSYSYDGFNWITDPRPLGYAYDRASDPSRPVFGWHFTNVFRYGGGLWGIGRVDSSVAGGSGGSRRYVMVQIAPNLRQLIGRPTPILTPDKEWEDADLNFNTHVIVDRGRLNVIYQSGNSFGLAVEAQ